MSGTVCDVCGGRAAASSLGAVGYAYCGGCAAARLEPYRVIVGAMFCVGGLVDELDFTYIDIIDQSLAAAGKTRDQLRADVDALTERYMAAMRREEV